MPAPASIDDFLDLARRSKQVDADRLAAFLAGRDGGAPTDVRRAAALLVKEGLLTNFQAEQFLQGKYRGFHLGGYRILERIGRGGGGAVYLAEHEAMRRRVALKVLPPAIAADPAALARFQREAVAAAALDHPNIVRAYDFRHEGPLHFLVMEYVAGPSLQQVLDRKTPIDVAAACDYARQAALGLHHAHQAGIVHRDVKPGNLLVDPSGTVKILDMGLARFVPPGQESVTKQFDDKAVMGTADYIAPEQAISLHGVDARADVYSLGATLYALLAGEPPFAGGSVTQKLLWHQMREPVRLDKRRPDVSPELADVVSRLMAKAPEARPESARAAAEELAPFCAGVPVGQGSAGGKVIAATHSGKLPGTPRTAAIAADAQADTVVDSPERSAEIDSGIRRKMADVGRGRVRLYALLGGTAVIAGVVAVTAFVLMNRRDDASPAKKDPPARRRLPDVPGVVYSVRAHAKSATRVTFSPDGDRLATSGADGVATIRDAVTGDLLVTLRGHTAAVHECRFDADGSRLLTTSDDGTARLWSLPDGKEVNSFAAPGPALCGAFGRDGDVVVGLKDGAVQVYGADGMMKRTASPHKGSVTAVAVRPEANEIVTSSYDGSVVVLDYATLEAKRTCKGHSGLVTSLALVGTDRALSGGYDSKVRLWDVASAKELHAFAHKQGQVWAVASSPDGTRAASGGADRRVYVWDVAAKTLVRAMEGHAAQVNGVAFSPDGRHIASVGDDGTLRVWGVP